MPGFLILLPSDNRDGEDTENIAGAINLAGNLTVQSEHRTDSFFAVTAEERYPLKGERLFENDDWIVLFAGALNGHSEIPHYSIIDNLEENNYRFFGKLEGLFSIAAYHKNRKVLYVISDRRSQYPVYYYYKNNRMVVASDLAAFCRLKEKPAFNNKWLWEYLYFNYPVDDSTFLERVKRIPPASVLIYDTASQDYCFYRYAANFKKREELIGGSDALEYAVEIFSERIPKYFRNEGETACALTGGWDGRTMLALAPESNITGYTYGIPGCHDLEAARETAEIANISHIQIPFGEKFVKELPRWMEETVFLSSGLQNIARATLLYAYRELTRCGRKFPVIISGIALDMIFRGHAHSPNLISEETADLFAGGEYEIRKDHWASIINHDYSSFRDHILGKIKALEENFGPFNSTEHHLSYILYVLSTQYFCGELKISDYFSRVRVPCWDSEIIDLSYSIEHSTLSFSQFSEHKRGDIRELILQSYLLKRLAPVFAGIPVDNTRPDIVLRGKLISFVYKVYRGIIKRASGSGEPMPLEDWNRWLNHIYKDYINNLIFSGDSRIREYLRDDYLDELSENRNSYPIGKIATVEMILRFMEKGWQSPEI